LDGIGGEETPPLQAFAHFKYLNDRHQRYDLSLVLFVHVYL
jgi:hypothetical protein